jgi:O-antigen/teichoic acid export membrane protein
VAYYSVAANLVLFIGGLQHALFSPLIARGAELSAQNEASGIAVAQLLVKSTRYAGFILWITGLPLIIFAPQLFQIWMGGDYAHYASPILIILVFANIVRMISAPYAFLLIATGEQQKTILTPILEACSNLVFSILLGWQFGAIGVAFGTLIGAFVAVSGHVIYNASRTFDKISITPQTLFVAWIKPSYYFFILSTLFIGLQAIGFSSIWLKIGFCLTGVISMIVLLHKNERDFILHKIGILKLTAIV